MIALLKIFHYLFRIGRDRAQRSVSEDARSRPFAFFLLFFFLPGYASADSIYNVLCDISACAVSSTSGDAACNLAFSKKKSTYPYSTYPFWQNASVVYRSSSSACIYTSGTESHSWAVSVSPGCSSGTVWDDASQSCKAAPKPVSCPDGQSGATGTCVPTSSAPSPGSGAPKTSVPVGTTDPGGNFTPDPGGLLGDGGGGSTGGKERVYNCGGWECVVTPSDVVPNSCRDQGVGTPTTCDYVPKYTGNPASTGEPTASPPQTGDSNDKTPSVGCPAGYTLDASTGLCTSGGNSGTPSTSGQPGSGSSPGAATCPTGYTLGADGECRGTGVNPGAVGTCPDGYTQDASGLCVSQGKIGGDGKPAGNGTGSCGGVNEPPCEVDWGQFKPSDPDAISDTDGIRGVMKSPLDDLMNWTPQASAGECPTPSFSAFGQSYTFSSHCDMMENLRGVIESVSLFIWAIAALFIVLSA